MTSFNSVEWYLLGLLGSVILWAAFLKCNAWPDKKEIVWCPTPFAFIFITFCSFLGVVSLFVGVTFFIIITIMEWVSTTDALDRNRFIDWLFRPICKKKD